MRIHLLALCHTIVSKKYSVCAYTQKCLNFAKMMTSKGYDVIEYGPAGSESAATEHVTTITRDEQCRFWGNMEPNLIHNADWFPESPWWQLTNARAIQEIKSRKGKGDLLGIIAGFCQDPVWRAHPDLRPVEWGIGYSGIISDAFHVFESSAWMHCCYTQLAGSAYGANGRNYDTVIPNSFDATEFELGKGDGGYLLYVGRLIQRKGIIPACEAAKAAGLKLIIAGQGGAVKDGRLVFDGASLPMDNIEYVGTVDIAERNRLMGGAIALMAPTTYIEPFGGVAVEAMMNGTPVITVPWGAFPETVIAGETGFHCSTLREFVDAVEKAPSLDRKTIRERAIRLYSTDAAADMYDRYFQRLATLSGKGWYTL